MAPNKMFTTMPETINGSPVILRRPAIITTKLKANNAPTMAAIALSSATQSVNQILITTRANQAPDEVPNVSGDVKLFWVSCCIKLPVTPNKPPINNVIASRGNCACCQYTLAKLP